MVVPDSDSEGVQVVVLGNFNPAIFSPGWLLANELIRRDDYDQAVPQLIVPQLSAFQVAWLNCNVTPQRLVLGTDQPLEIERVRDIAISVLTLLSHTPINMIGINRYFHLRTPEARWHSIGDHLAPKDIWEGTLLVPGLQDVTMRSVRPDAYAGQITVSVQPSTKVQPGVFLMQNDHYVLKEVERQPASRAEFFDESTLANQKPPNPSMEYVPIAKRILADHWQASMSRAEALRGLVWTIGDAR